MGLFQHRPEEPTEWGGLPSEPLEPADPADLLGEATPLDIPLLGDIPMRTTISFTAEPVEPPQVVDAPADAGADD
jgi:hypothetical protein